MVLSAEVSVVITGSFFVGCSVRGRRGSGHRVQLVGLGQVDRHHMFGVMLTLEMGIALKMSLVIQFAVLGVRKTTEKRPTCIVVLGDRGLHTGHVFTFVTRQQLV